MEAVRLRVRKAMLGYDNNPNNSIPNFNNNRPEQSEPAEAKGKGIYGKVKDYTVEHKKGIAATGLVFLVASGGGYLFNKYCKKKHAKDQQKLASKAPKQEADVYERNEENRINVSHIKPSEHEVDNLSDKWEVVPEEYKEPFMSMLGREGVKECLIIVGLDGHLECNIPLDKLSPVKGNHSAMRGFSTKDGKFEHGEFKKAGMGRMTYSFIWEFMSAATLQHYLNALNESINRANKKLDQLLFLDENGDWGTLITIFEEFPVYIDKKIFTESDKRIMQQLYMKVHKLKTKYDKCLEKIELTTEYSYAEIWAARKQKAKLAESKYFCYLRMAIFADLCCYIASRIVWKIAKSLGEEEMERMYSKRLVLTPWGGHKEQFLHFKSGVLEFLNNKYMSANFSKKGIKEIRDEQQGIFDELEKCFDKIYQMSIFCRYDEDGNLRWCIPAEQATLL